MPDASGACSEMPSRLSTDASGGSQPMLPNPPCVVIESITSAFLQSILESPGAVPALGFSKRSPSKRSPKMRSVHRSVRATVDGMVENPPTASPHVARSTLRENLRRLTQEAVGLALEKHSHMCCGADSMLGQDSSNTFDETISSDTLQVRCPTCHEPCQATGGPIQRVRFAVNAAEPASVWRRTKRRRSSAAATK